MITLTITPVENVDYSAGKVIDNSNITKKNLEWDDPIRIFDTVKGRATNVIAHSVSLYDHRLILDDKHYHILHFYSVGK